MKLFGTVMLSALVVLASGQGPTAEGTTRKDLWSTNRHLKDQNMALIPWGSGSIAEADETAFEGAFSLRVATHNYFQGGVLKLNAPADVSSAYSDPNSLLLFSFRSGEETVVMNSPGSAAPGGTGLRGAASAGGGAASALPRGGRPESEPPQGVPGSSSFPSGPQGGPPRGYPGGYPGGAFPGSSQGPSGPAGAQGAPFGNPGQGSPLTSELKTVRVIIGTTDGKKSEAYLPLPAARPGKPWRMVSIPLQVINGFSKTNKIISSIGFSGDATAVYYVGALRVITDPTPITGEMNVKHDLNLALGDTVRFIGTANGGSSILRYTWDFDDSDGIQEDAVGQGVEHRFRKPGKYVVTLTVKDFYGLKKPYSTNIKVTVNP